MLRKCILTFFFITSSIVLHAQDTFIKSIKLGEFQTARQIVEYNDRLFVLFTGVCDEIIGCSLYMEIDDQGEILWQKQLRRLDAASKSMVIENDTIFISGNHPNRDKWLWHQMSVNGGDSLATYEIFDSSITYQLMSNFGTTKFGKDFCIYGSGEMGTYETSLLYIVNQHGQLDTLLDILTTDIDSDPWEVISDNDGNLVAFIRYREEGKDRQRVVAKINEDKELFWAYFSEENSQQDAIPNGAILEDGSIVYNSREQWNKAEKLRWIGPDSTITYSYNPTNGIGQDREFIKISTISDGSILGVSAYTDLSLSAVPWITKVSSDAIRIWERTYYALSENGDEQFGMFRDAVELEDGSIMAIGRISPQVGQPNEILIARFDSEGCLVPDCLVRNNVTDILSSTEYVPSIGFNIYPNPVQDILHISTPIIPIRAQIFTFDGTLILETSRQNDIDVSHLKQGIYFLKMTVDNQILTKRFVKM